MLTPVQQSLVRFMLAGGYHRDWRRYGWFNPTVKTFIPDTEIAKVETAADAACLLRDVHGLDLPGR